MNIQPISLWSVCGGSSRIYISGLCSIYHRQVSTRYSQTDWHCLHCHAGYEQSLATVSASTADETPLVPDLYVVHPTVYGSEAWTLLQEDLRKLEAFHMRCQRMILGIRWHDFIRNTEVDDTTSLPCIKDIITRRRNSLFGHDDHMPAHRALSQVADIRTGSCPSSRLSPVNRSSTQLVASSNHRRHVTPLGIGAEWTRARRRGHTETGLT